MTISEFDRLIEKLESAAAENKNTETANWLESEVTQNEENT